MLVLEIRTWEIQAFRPKVASSWRAERVASSMYFFLWPNTIPKVEQGEFFMPPSQAKGGSQWPIPSASWQEQTLTGHIYILVFLLLSKPFEVSLSKIAPERLLRLFSKTFYNLQFNMTNTHRIPVMLDMMLKLGCRFPYIPNYFQGLIYLNQVC